MEDLKVVENICRHDAGVIAQCEISGISPKDMDKVYCDRESNAVGHCRSSG